MIVIDASVAIELLLPTDFGQRHIDTIFAQKRHAPYLIDIEFLSGLRRLARAGAVDAPLARHAIETMREWSLHRHDQLNLLPRIWELRNSVSAYDAAYVALAEALDLPLLTCDGKLSRSHGHRAEIVLLS
jgi:predicted nucleic acid-binding protein